MDGSRRIRHIDDIGVMRKSHPMPWFNRRPSVVILLDFAERSQKTLNIADYSLIDRCDLKHPTPAPAYGQAQIRAKARINGAKMAT